MSKVLDNTEVQRRLGTLAGWTLSGGKLVRAFQFDDFVSAFGFMTQVAIVAERRNHHPNWSNVWNKVNIELTTHEAGGITGQDFDLAQEINEIAKP